MSPHTTAKAAGRFALLAALAASLSGCTWQGYAVGRGVRTLTGGPTRTHTVVPLAESLRRYHIIETHWLDDQLGGRMPAGEQRDLNDGLVAQLRGLPSRPDVRRADPDPSDGSAPEPDVAGAPTLVLDGSIDDYDRGYEGLRLVELGFNHLVVTVRVRLRDKQTGRVLAAASITAQDDRVTATTRGTIRRLVRHIGSFVRAGYAR